MIQEQAMQKQRDGLLLLKQKSVTKKHPKQYSPHWKSENHHRNTTKEKAKRKKKQYRDKRNPHTIEKGKSDGRKNRQEKTKEYDSRPLKKEKATEKQEKFLVAEEREKQRKRKRKERHKSEKQSPASEN